MFFLSHTLLKPQPIGDVWEPLENESPPEVTVLRIQMENGANWKESTGCSIESNPIHMQTEQYGCVNPVSKNEQLLLDCQYLTTIFQAVLHCLEISSLRV